MHDHLTTKPVRVAGYLYRARCGLAHAAYRPVVFATGALEDAPFDLRHLRIASYDIRDPAWGERLKVKLAVYLKAAKADPAKSVPPPFRRLLVDEAIDQ